MRVRDTNRNEQRCSEWKVTARNDEARRVEWRDRWRWMDGEMERWDRDG